MVSFSKFWRLGSSLPCVLKLNDWQLIDGYLFLSFISKDNLLILKYLSQFWAVII